MADEAVSRDLSDVRGLWTVTPARVLETGSVCAKLWVRLAGGSSQLDLILAVSANRDAVDVEACLLWNERAARLANAVGACAV